MALSAKNETIQVLTRQVDGIQMQLAQVTVLLEYRKPEVLAPVQKQIDWRMIVGLAAISAALMTYYLRWVPTLVHVVIIKRTLFH